MPYVCAIGLKLTSTLCSLAHKASTRERHWPSVARLAMAFQLSFCHAVSSVVLTFTCVGALGTFDTQAQALVLSS